MLGRADPVGVDRLRVIGVGLATPAEQELLGRRLALGDDVVRSRVAAVMNRGRLGDDRHHLRREPGEIVASVLGIDVDELLELPDRSESRGLRLEVGRRAAGQGSRIVRLRIRHSGLEVLVHEQAPHLLVRDFAHELLDVDPAIAKRAALPVGLGDLRLEGDDAFEPWFEVAHLPGNL